MYVKQTVMYLLLNYFRQNSLFELLYGHKVKAVVEMDDISASFKIPECEAFSFGLVSGQISLERYAGIKGNYCTVFITFNNLNIFC